MTRPAPSRSSHTRKSLPYDLLLLLIAELTGSSSLATLAKLQRCCKSYYALITPLLYRSVHITSDEQLQSFLTIQGGKKARKAAKSLSIPPPLPSSPGAKPNCIAGSRSRAHSVGSVVRQLGLESPKMVEKRKAKEQAQVREFVQRLTASADPSPYASPHSSQVDLNSNLVSPCTPSPHPLNNDTHSSAGSSSSACTSLSYTKSEAFWLTESLTLDIYPSRTSLKLASKLSTSSLAALPRVARLTLTPQALLSLHGKLGQSQAPRIIAEYWATHAPALVRPKEVRADYTLPNKILDVKTLLGESAAAVAEDKEVERWGDTMWGISAMIQQYGPIDLTLRGQVWAGILASPGTRVRVEHVNHGELAGHDTASTTTPASALAVATPAPLPALAAGPNPAQATPPIAPVDPSTAARTQLLNYRRQALVRGLRSSFAIAEHARASPASPAAAAAAAPKLQIELVDFFPPRPVLSSSASIRTYDTVSAEEDEREKDQLVREMLAELDEKVPEFTRRYEVRKGGKRALGCLIWNESEGRGVVI